MNTGLTAINAAVAEHSSFTRPLFNELSKVIVGQSYLTERLVIGLLANGHVLLEGVPGLAKTLAVKSLANCMHVKFARLQFTPDMLPADVIGTQVYNPQSGNFTTRKGPVFANLVLADEINRAPAKVQSALLEAMQEKQVTIGDQTYRLEEPFLVLATQNPIEQEGTYPLPEAQLDRFFFKLLLGYSTREELATILERTTAGTSPEIQPVLDAEAILAHQKLVRRVRIEPVVQDFAVRLTLATHPKGPFATPLVNRFLRFGASPRAAQTMVLAGKVRALLAGRPFVNADDLKSVALPALRHRVMTNFEAEAEGKGADEILQNLVETTPPNAA